MSAGYTVAAARYSRGNFVVQPSDNIGGYKGNASYLCEALNMRWVHRGRGYVASPPKLRKFERLFKEGWRATCMGELIAP